MANDTSTTSHTGRKIFLWFIFILIAGTAIAFFIFNQALSDGNKAGVLIDFAHKGVAFKTYEGQLNIGGMGNIPNTAQANEIWHFSVADKKMADTLAALSGKRVNVHYHEIVKAMFWQGETNYFVDAVTVIDK